MNDASGALADFTAAAALRTLSPRHRAVALLNLGAAKHRIGETGGAIADLTRLIEVPGVPVGELSKALANRGIAHESLAATDLALRDWQRVLGLPDAPSDVATFAAVKSFGILWRDGDNQSADKVLDSFARLAEGWPEEAAVDAVTQLLSNLDSPTMREGWPHACRRLAQIQSPNVKMVIGFFEPVCKVLEGAAESILDSLAPEHREFVQKVLARFKEDMTAPGSAGA